MLIDLVVPFFNEQDVIDDFLKEISSIGTGEDWALNVIFVNDGSSDATVKKIQEFQNNLETSIINFSRNFGKEKAIYAGLTKTTSKYVIIMDSDLQHPVRLIPELINAIRINKVEMVYTVNNLRSEEPILIKWAKNTYYSTMNRMGAINHIRNAGDYRIMSRKVVEDIIQYKGNNFYMKGLYHWAGYSSIGINYTPDVRKSGASKYNFLNLFKLGMRGITGNSYIPLYLSFFIGLAVFFATTIFSIYIIVVKFLGIITLPGFATIVVLVSSLFAVNFLILGCIGLYLGRIMENIDGRPRYVIDEIIKVEPRDDKR